MNEEPNFEIGPEIESGLLETSIGIRIYKVGEFDPASFETFTIENGSQDKMLESIYGN